MRLCRFQDSDGPRAAFYLDEFIVPLDRAARLYKEHTHKDAQLPSGDDLLLVLPPDGSRSAAARDVGAWLEANPGAAERTALPLSKASLLAPIPRPPKLFLLAGNYAKHIEEGGGIAVERQATFPYVFMKPPTTTIDHPAAEIAIPSNSPDHIDWEVELAVVIGREARRVDEKTALEHVAGFTVINDISDRKFRPNPARRERPKDSFFDWLHGKWHDGFCPMGPCVRSADSALDPQALRLRLEVNGKTMQDSSTAQQIFPVAAVVSFISNIVTLEPGDVISTGTPSGVGNSSETYLKPGDLVEASIDGIGTLRNRMTQEGENER